MVMTCEFLVVGAGIAGFSLAARLGRRGRRVIVLEMEDAAPLHATGRSAGLLDLVYVPNGDVGGLARASAPLLQAMPGILTPKEVLHLYGDEDAAEFGAAAAASRSAGLPVEELDADAVERRFPFVRRSAEHCAAALRVPPELGAEIDVAALHAAHGATIRVSGGVVLRDEALLSAARAGGAWTVRTRTQTLRADVVVNAAGAWADIVAARCGVEPLGLQPLLRTVVETSVAPHPFMPAGAGPFVFWSGAEEDLYASFRRGRALISLADEQASQPCDATPDDDDVALAVHRLEQRTHLQEEGRSRRAWAGLRTFARDRRPVIGWDGGTDGFLWSGAYGGFGIECSPAASAVACDLLLGEKRFSAEAIAQEVYPARFDPGRLSLESQHR